MSKDLQAILTDPKRLEALRRTLLLDSQEEETFDRLTRLASTILDAPISLVSLVEPDRQFFKSQIGLKEPTASERQTPISHSFCQHVVTSGEPLIIEDARDNPLVCDNPAIQDLDVIAYLGIPLVSADGWHLGSLCVIDNEPREWNTGEIETLRTLAASVTAEIQLRTEAREKEQALSDLRARNEELDAFAHTVSHNLKNPISGILGWASISQRYADRVTLEDVLDNTMKISELAEHSNTIINSLLLLAGIGRHDHLPFEKIEMFPTVENVMSRLAYEIVENEVKINLPDDLPPCFGYGDWIEEVWMNYVSNAIKYGGNPPEITLGADELSDGFVRYWVKDNGSGMTSDEQAALFLPFSRLPQTADVEGHGLGLSIVARIVTKLGGEVGVESAPGEGSTFSFTLPTQAG